MYVCLYSIYGRGDNSSALLNAFEESYFEVIGIQWIVILCYTVINKYIRKQNTPPKRSIASDAHIDRWCGIVFV